MLFAVLVTPLGSVSQIFDSQLSGGTCAPAFRRNLKLEEMEQDIYCLNADGSLFDAALLSAVAAIAHLHIPLVSLNDDGRVIAMPGEHFKGKTTKEVVNKDKRKLSLRSIPFSLTCLLHKEHILADPTAEEESIMDAPVTVVLNSEGMMVSMYKPGGGVLALTSTVQDCLSLSRKRVMELQNILDQALNFMEVDED